MIGRASVLALTIWPCIAATGLGAEPPPESRAIRYLEQEVPRWARENTCYSCHNNGDAAHALYLAIRLGDVVKAEALADTNRWLSQPERWDHNRGEGPFSDKRLARIQFSVALEAAVEAGQIPDRTPLIAACDRLVAEQSDEGLWILDDADSLGTPATYGRPLATLQVRDALAAADAARYREPIVRADRWLKNLRVRSVLDAAVVLPVAEAAQRKGALDLLRKGQSPDGGWGPYVNDPPEPFDTAVVLLSLKRINKRNDAELTRMIERGRAFLTASQLDDGSWPETTRPSGGESYAQRLSTTGWATMALLATRPATDHRPRSATER